MFKRIIKRFIQQEVRKSIIDWPMDFGVETAVMNEVDGDYHEFGVYQGRSFIKNATAFRKQLPAARSKAMKFWAYDSFEGLPETNDKFAPAHFTKGAFSASRELFSGNVKAAGIDEASVEIVPGFYDRSLNDLTAQKAFSSRKIAMTYIDCDIYESAVPIFDFITRGLQVGSVIVIDDWVRHHTHPQHGIQRAFHEWLARNPQIKLNQIALTKRAMFVVYAV